MLRDISCLYDDTYFSDQSYEKLAIIESCQEALLEDTDDYRVITTANSYTYSLVMEVLENVKEALLKLWSTVLSILNNFILNNAKMVDKYRELIKVKFKSLKEPFIFVYYEYPGIKDYPKVIKSNAWVEAEVQKLQEEIISNDWNSEKVEFAVDSLLKEFSEQVVGLPIDPDRLKASTEKVVREKIQGKKIDRGLTVQMLDQFIDEIRAYKVHLDDLKKTKTAILKDYELLKAAYKNAIKPPIDIKQFDRLAMLHDPEDAGFKLREKERFAYINIQITRLFNGFIEIYNTAFNTKLTIIRERVDMNNAIITELLTRTSVLAAINVKNPSKDRKPFEYIPKV